MRLHAAAALALACGPAAASELAAVAAGARPPAIAIDVDGVPDEAAWEGAAEIADFVQRTPTEGAPARSPTRVRFLYDADALYVAAWLEGAEEVRAPVTRHDDGGEADSITVYLDTFHDRRTAYAFGVTAAGVRLDGYFNRDDEWAYDGAIDPVWAARVRRHGSGWTAEMRIPLAQVRFRPASLQIWGLNVRRFVAATNEESFWVAMAKDEGRWASRFGQLRGLQGLRGGRRRELLPYLAGDARLPSAADPADPFGGSRTAGRGGVDAKVAIGRSLNLDATFLPDFGQVEADPAEVNLTTFETFFTEKRPFFVEGAEHLVGPGLTYFYSRRIGAAPRPPLVDGYSDTPRSSTILGAGKLTGRTADGNTSLGGLVAVTAEEHARISGSGGLIGRERVAPRTVFGVGRVQRVFGPAQSVAGVMATAVVRDLPAGDPLAARAASNALSLSADCIWRLAGGRYEAFTGAGFSHVAGQPGAILGLQQSSSRYYQRPDAGHVEVDPARRSLQGFMAEAAIEKKSGRHWLGFVNTSAISPGFEINDAGLLAQADVVRAQVQVEWRDNQPRRPFRERAHSLSTLNRWTFGRERLQTSLTSYNFMSFRNFWTSIATATVNLPAQDPRLTRGGPSMATPRSWTAALSTSTSSSARTSGRLALNASGAEDGSRMRRLSMRLTSRPLSRLRLALEPFLEQRREARQYVGRRSGGRPSMDGQRYVFAAIDRTTLSAQLRLTMAFNPDLTFEVYGEPFAADGFYSGFGELREGGGRELILDPSLGDPGRDFDQRSFRSNAVLRWEYRPGSTLYAVWQQDRFESRDPRGTRAGDLIGALGAPGDHVLAVKLSFWVPLR